MKEYAQNTKQLARTIQGSGRDQKVGFVDNRTEVEGQVLIQMMIGTDTPRKISNSTAQNMRMSLASYFRGKVGKYKIDQDSGQIFADGVGAVGHHFVEILDKNENEEGVLYYCDFHSNGTYFSGYRKHITDTRIK